MQYISISCISFLCMAFFLFSSMLYSGFGVPKVLGACFIIDGLSWSFIMLTLWIGMLVILYSSEMHKPLWHTYVVMSLVFILVVGFSCSSGLMFYVFFEGSLLPTVALIIGWGTQFERFLAGKYLMMYTVGGSMPLLMCLVAVYCHAGHTSFFFMEWPMVVSEDMKLLWWLGLSGAFLVKVPVYMGHLWLPKAHVQASVGGSMMLAGILLKLGIYGLLRVYCECIFFGSIYMGVLAPLALWGSVVSGAMCLRQSDMKAMVAYSSVAHMGLILGGMSSGSEMGLVGSLSMSVSHGLCSSGLFVLVGIAYNMTGTRSIYLVKGLLTICPSLSFWWFLLTVLNMGAPPSLCFLSEVLLIGSSLSFSYVLAIPLGLMVFFSGVYSLVFYSSTQHGCPKFSYNTLVMRPRVHLVLSLHVIPLILLVLCPGDFLNWL